MDLTNEQLTEVLHTVEKASHISVSEAAVRVSAIAMVGFVFYHGVNKMFPELAKVKK